MPGNFHFCPPMLFFTLEGSYLSSKNSIITHFTNSSGQIKDPEALSAAKKLGETPPLSPNQVIWNVEWRQMTRMHIESLPPKARFNTLDFLFLGTNENTFGAP